jgi:hypothetical protein
VDTKVHEDNPWYYTPAEFDRICLESSGWRQAITSGDYLDAAD